MIDSKLQVLSDSVATVVNKMDFICSLSSELDLSDEINDCLYSAKNSLYDSKLLIHVRLLQVTNVHTEIDIKASKLVDDLDDVKVGGDGEGANDSNISKLKNENNIKLEEDRLTAAAEVFDVFDSYEGDDYADDLLDAEQDQGMVVTVSAAEVETKIEVEDDDDENVSLPHSPVVKRRQRKKRKANSETPKRKKRRSSFMIEPILVPANHTADPANQTADADEADNQLDENDPEFLLQNIINSEEGRDDDEWNGDEGPPGTKYLCPICGKTKDTKTQFRDHVKFHKSKAKCLQCPEIVARYEMPKHVEVAHGGPSPRVPKTTCRHCYKSFVEEEYKVHITVCSPFQIQCAVCGKICNGRKSHTTHMRIHNRPQIYPCDMCEKKFRTVGEMNRHKTHKHLDTKTCDICGQDGMSIYNLKIHMKIHEENRERQYSCDECGMSFHKIHGLKNHMATHTEEKPFTCEMCNKSFKYKNSMVAHMKLHNEETPRVKCEHCGRAFIIKKYLRKHQRQVHKITFSSVRARRSAN